MKNVYRETPKFKQAVLRISTMGETAFVDPFYKALLVLFSSDQ